MTKRIELLAPAGDMEKLKTAIYFGADAVYFAGKNYGLRALSSNFDNDEIKEAADFVHRHGKKCYVTINVYARNDDFVGLDKYLKVLIDAKIDAVIVSDFGLINYIREHAPTLPIHVSTQANTTNKYSVKAYTDMGIERVVLARELSIKEIQEIHDHNPNTELECFVHGAMCISYSGRCLLSNYMTGRDSNHGACAQACRWHYSIIEDSRPDDKFEMQEDDRGAYILNSKDLCLVDYIDKIASAGVTSFKVEGRMKSPYYVATVINAYRRAIDYYYECEKYGKKYKAPDFIHQELVKPSHRKYTTGFMFNDGQIRQNYESSIQTQESKFVGIVVDFIKGAAVIEQRNKFSVGDKLEILSPTDSFNKTITVKKILNKKGQEVDSAKLVQERVTVFFDEDIMLSAGDILRM